MSNKAKIREDAMSLNPIDDALFCKMAEDIRFCQEILQVILEDESLKVLSHVPQFTAKNMQGRSCILDLKCRLGDSRLVDVEVQKANDDKSDVAALMKVFTEDNAYDDVKFPFTSSIKRRFKTTEEGVSEMCEVIERNRAEAAEKATEKAIRNLMDSCKWTIEQAMAALKIPESDYPKYMAML
ncbi:MAG: hypothetical protein U0K23_09910 [Selenomonadaceae bacterium]|nr:hypothetical protein [Selenomonadaceae bacterium]